MLDILDGHSATGINKSKHKSSEKQDLKKINSYFYMFLKFA